MRRTQFFTMALVETTPNPEIPPVLQVIDVPVEEFTPTIPCLARLSGASSFNRNGGIGTVAIQMLDGCLWRASKNASWITIPGSRTGAGPGSVNYVVGALTSGTSRTGLITFAISGVPDLSVVIRQEDAEGADPPFRYFVTPERRSIWWEAVAVGRLRVTTSRQDAEWNATSNQSWLIVTGPDGPAVLPRGVQDSLPVETALVARTCDEGACGRGNTFVYYRVMENPLQATRTGTITVAGLSGLNPPVVFTLSQAGRP